MAEVAAAFEPLRPEYREPREWFALLVIPSWERRSFNWLKRLRFMPYWPTFTKQRRSRGHLHRPILCGVIPGYMFLPLAADHSSSWAEILGDGFHWQGVPGIREVLRDGEHPRPLSEGDIERIRSIEAALNSDVICAELGIPFKVGERVQFVDELFRAFWDGGTILEIDSERRIRIEVEDVLGGAPFWVAASQIEAM
jgi:hypothetical protein